MAISYIALKSLITQYSIPNNNIYYYISGDGYAVAAAASTRQVVFETLISNPSDISNFNSTYPLAVLVATSFEDAQHFALLSLPLISSVAQSIRSISNTTTITSVAASTSSVVLLAANAARFGSTIANDTDGILYIKLGIGASISSYTVKLAVDSYYESPFGYVGIITGVWDTMSGSARVTELFF